jgi:hypothetical protein
MTTRLARLTLALAVASTPGWAAVIDFEGVASSGNPIRTGTLTVDGFDFTSDHFHIIDDPGICFFGGCVAPEQYIWEEAGALGEPITMTMAGGGTFSFEGFDVDQAFNDSAAAAAGGFPNADIFEVLVTFGGGGSTLFTFAGDGGPSFQTIALGLTDVLSVQFSGLTSSESPGGLAIDNIRVNEQVPVPVPEPGTLLLLGAGITALARRRKRNA